jgi:hypothetical protein
MSKLIKIILLSFFILLVNGCSSAPESHRGDSNGFLKLSTEGVPKQDLTDDQIIEESNPNPLQQESDTEEQTLPEEEHNQEQLNQDTQQQTIPDDPIIEELVPEEEGQGQISQAMVATKLPFQDFKDRWNAVTDEQMSNLYIRNFDEVASNEGIITYSSNLTNKLELRVFVAQNYIQQLEMINREKSDLSIESMLTGWSQMINILHPDIEIYDVDTLFNKIGVGPNGDLSELKPISISYSDLHYEVVPTENGYSFRASYSNSQ